MKYPCRLIVLLLITCFLAACADKPVHYYRYSDATYPPTDEIDILHEKPLWPKFTKIGEIRLCVDGTNQETAILSVQEKAKTVGADAVIILGTQEISSLRMPDGFIYTAVPFRELVAVAIRYK